MDPIPLTTSHVPHPRFLTGFTLPKSDSVSSCSEISYGGREQDGSPLCSLLFSPEAGDYGRVLHPMSKIVAMILHELGVAAPRAAARQAPPPLTATCKGEQYCCKPPPIYRTCGVLRPFAVKRFKLSDWLLPTVVSCERPVPKGERSLPRDQSSASKRYLIAFIKLWEVKIWQVEYGNECI